jgi:hypothetical protein
MAENAVFPCSRKRKMSAPTDLIRINRPTSMEIQGSEIFDSAFLADRGCFSPMYPRRKPMNVLPDQRKLA